MSYKRSPGRGIRPGHPSGLLLWMRFVLGQRERLVRRKKTFGAERGTSAITQKQTSTATTDPVGTSHKPSYATRLLYDCFWNTPQRFNR